MVWWDRAFGPGGLTEVVRFDEIGAEIAHAPAFPAIPLTILTAGRTPPRWAMPAALWAIHQANQRELAALSPRGSQVILDHSDHHIPTRAPESVRAALREMIAEIGGPT